MTNRRPRHHTLLIWITGYLWTVPAAIAVSRVLDWQYDGDIGWWIVMAYTAPIIMLTEPFGSAISFVAYTIAYNIVLFAMTFWVVRNWDAGGFPSGD